MNRLLLSAEELEQWLSRELRKVKGCGECSVGGIMALQQADSDGCNWSDSVVVRSGQVDSKYVRPYFDKIVAEATETL